MSDLTVFDDRACILGEGPLWHPEREQLFWFDILGKKMMTRTKDGAHEWQFDRFVSAAGWIDRERLLIASQTNLFIFDLETGVETPLCHLEADNAVTRSNDGRADPQGGFWIGTMGIDFVRGAGAIYRWYRGRLEQLYDNITVSNSICFSPDGRTAYWTDTVSHQIMRQALDAEGWPDGPAEVHVDLTDERLFPDGSVVDANGNLWNAQWGSGRVAQYGTDGRFLSAIDIPAGQATCPAFGNGMLYVTSATEGAKMDDVEAGRTFAIPSSVTGQREHQVILQS